MGLEDEMKSKDVNFKAPVEESESNEGKTESATEEVTFDQLLLKAFIERFKYKSKSPVLMVLKDLQSEEFEINSPILNYEGIVGTTDVDLANKERATKKIILVLSEHWSVQKVRKKTRK